MKNNVFGQVSGAAIVAVAGIMVLALGTPGAGALPPKNDAYAVIFATPEGACNDPIVEGLALYDWLLGHGWVPNHIKFLADNQSADGMPTVNGIHSAISYIANHTNWNSLVFIAALDHTQDSPPNYYYHASDGNISNSQMGSWVNEIHSFNKMTIVVGGMHSGGFIPSLEGANRVVATSHASPESLSPHHYKLSEGLGTPSADINHDGYVSFQEAHNYEVVRINQYWPGSQTPQLHDHAGTVILNVH
jgi:hypothetical protein